MLSNLTGDCEGRGPEVGKAMILSGPKEVH